MAWDITLPVRSNAPDEMCHTHHMNARPHSRFHAHPRSSSLAKIRSSGLDGLHTKDEDIETEKGMVRGYVQQYAAEIAMLLSKVDRQMLLLFKTNDCLRLVATAREESMHMSWNPHVVYRG